MRTILLSFTYDWFEVLQRGEKKFEYRKKFPENDTLVYFYVSRPVSAITGMAHFGKREELADWLVKYKDRSLGVRARIRDYLLDCRYAIPMDWFQKTNAIGLEQLRQEAPGFEVPRMYISLDGTELLEYLKREIKPIGKRMEFSFEEIKDEDIC